MERDREHLRWLSIFHYVMAALVPLGGLCFGGIYMSIGLVALIVIGPERLPRVAQQQ